MNLEFSLQNELVQLPFQVTEQQWIMYEKAREVLYSDPRSPYFVQKIKRNMIERPDSVTSNYDTGENRGTNKTLRAAQRIAEILFNHRFRNRLMSETNREPAAHYLSLGMIAKELRNERKITSPHPDYTLEDFMKMWIRMRQTVSLSRVNLPKMYPDKVHFLDIEIPFSLIGDAMVVDTDTFVDIRKTNIQAQSEAFDQSSQLISDNSLIDVFLQHNVIMDDPSINKEEITENMGTRDTGQLGWQWMNKRMFELQDELRLSDQKSFSIEDLRTSPYFRNEVVMPAFYQYYLKYWRIPKGHGFVGENPYINENKYLLWKLIQAFKLNMRAVREYSV